MLGKKKPSATLISEVRSVFFPPPSLTAVKNKGGAVARYVVTAGFQALSPSLPAFEIQSAVLEENYL